MTPPNVLMIGAGEYTTGHVHGEASRSDKGPGVVALSLFDLRRRAKVGRLAMAAAHGVKFPGIRRHLERTIGARYRDMDIAFDSFPNDDVEADWRAYCKALDCLDEGDVVTVFTPDDTHFRIAMEAVERGCHVLVAKPIVKTLRDHLELAEAARRRNVLVAMEVHKRWDPIYADARDRIRSLGPFSFFSSYMSQPKSQLDTFRNWAGKSSDISYYLNAHHVDFNFWSVGRFARPVRAAAMASTGLANGKGVETEDAITISAQWENIDSGSLATAVYTASWIAPRSDVHSQQRFFYMGHKGEIAVDQAHRGYDIATDAEGYSSPNPLFMKYTPDAQGRFAGQSGYGYRSIEAFVDAARAIRQENASPSDFAGRLATIEETTPVTAVLEAGRRSLDSGGRPHGIHYDSDGRAASLSPD